MAPQYRSAVAADVRSSDTAPGSLKSRLLGSLCFLFCGVFGVVFLVTRKMHAFDERLGMSLLIAVMIAGALFALSAHSILGYHRDLSKKQARLSEPDAVETFEVHASRVVEIEAPGSTGPALCFQLPDRTILLLYGQWLLEHSLYRAKRPRGDGNQKHFNALNAPHAFPSDHFIIHRWRGESQPFWIEVRGRYLPVEEFRAQLPRAAKAHEMELVEGSLDSLQQDLDRAFTS